MRVQSEPDPELGHVWRGGDGRGDPGDQEAKVTKRQKIKRTSVAKMPELCREELPGEGQSSSELESSG